MTAPDQTDTFWTQPLTYPEPRQRSILNPMPLGQTPDGRTMAPNFRDSSAYLWGQRGSGATTAVANVIAGGIQCTDALVWTIGDRLAHPFLHAYGQGQADRPCIDWVATTTDDARWMADAALDIAADRRHAYRDLRFEYDTWRTPIGTGAPGNPPPHILIVVDDVDLLSDDAAGRLGRVMELSNAGAVTVVFTGLRATADASGLRFKAGTPIRLGMRVTDPAELAYGFGDYNLEPEPVLHMGGGHIRCDFDQPTERFKVHLLGPKVQAALGSVTADWQPVLDAPSRKAAGDRYATRWAFSAPRMWTAPRPEILTYR